MVTPFLSLVIPAYQQAGTICAELKKLHRLLEQLVHSHEIILVIDGDEDGTSDTVKGLNLPNLRIDRFAYNQGKGMALRHGLSQARGELVAFIDSGGDLDPTFLEIMLVELKLHKADIVIGSKRHSLSEVAYPPLRRLYSTVYQLLNRLLFRLRIRDTQVGLKLFRREVLEAVLPRILVKQFAFDLELLVVANHLGFTRIVEAPIRLQHNFVSSISSRSALQTLWDTLAVFYRLHIKHWYDRDRSLPAPTVSSPLITLTVHQSINPSQEPVSQPSQLESKPVITSQV